VQAVQRNRLAQQQRIGIELARLRERQRLGIAPTVQQPVRMHSQGVDIGIGTGRLVETGLRRRVIAHALRQFGPDQRQPSVVRRSARSMIGIPIRSLIDPPGLKNSAFTYTGVRMPRVTRLRRMSGVQPISASTSS